MREALRRLAAEGLVVVAANRRSYVAEFDPFEADAVFEIRSRLESFAAELAAAKIGAAGIEKLEVVCDQIETLGPRVHRDSLIQFLTLNNAFHKLILAGQARASWPSRFLPRLRSRYRFSNITFGTRRSTSCVQIPSIGS